MRRVRQFGQVRSSRYSSASKITNQSPFAFKLQKTEASNSTYLCVDCVNHSLSKDKNHKKQQEKAKGLKLRKHWEKTVKNEEQKQRLLNERKVENQRRQLLEGNMTLSRIKKIKNQEKQAEKKQQLLQQMRITKQLDERQTAELYREKLLKKTWLQNIKGQVAMKQKQKNQQMEQKLAQQPDKAIFHSDFSKHQENHKKAYQTELIKQINEKKERQIKQKRQNYKTIDIQSMPIVDQAEQRDVYFKKVEQQRKRMLIEEAKKKQEQIKEAKRKKQILNIEQKQGYERMMQNQYQRVHQLMKSKQKKMSDYINDVKLQIQTKKEQKREKSIQKLFQREQFILPMQRKMSTKECDSCSKSVEKMYLTRFLS